MEKEQLDFPEQVKICGLYVFSKAHVCGRLVIKFILFDVLLTYLKYYWNFRRRLHNSL